MKEIKGSIEIDAPADMVWRSLVDFESYPDWNPFIVNMTGELKKGNVYKVVVTPSGRKKTVFPSKVVDLHVGKGIVFKGRIMGGLMVDDHVFSVEELGPDRTRFFQSIVFKGALVPFANGVIRDCQIGLDEMNGAMKRRCEADRRSQN